MYLVKGQGVKDISYSQYDSLRENAFDSFIEIDDSKYHNRDSIRSYSNFNGMRKHLAFIKNIDLVPEKDLLFWLTSIALNMGNVVLDTPAYWRLKEILKRVN